MFVTNLAVGGGSRRMLLRIIMIAMLMMMRGLTMMMGRGFMRRCG